MRYLGLKDPAQLMTWARTLINQLNASADPFYNLPIATDDAAAAALGVDIGNGYKTAAGVVRWRVS